METTNVYKFKIFYSADDTEAMFRYVVAETEDEACEKLEAHFEMMHREGFAKPLFCSDPIVYIEGAVI